MNDIIREENQYEEKREKVKEYMYGGKRKGIHGGKSKGINMMGGKANQQRKNAAMTTMTSFTTFRLARD